MSFKPIIVALDFSSAYEAETLADQLDPQQCRLKIGKELFTRCGPDIVTEMTELGFDVFLDLKFHDIPNTVARAVAAAADLGVWMLNVHASGGPRMMEAAVKELEPMGLQAPILTAVTMLTSLDADELAATFGGDWDVAASVSHMAAVAKKCGVDGVVCSAHEAAQLRADMGRDFVLVTPGIRPVGSDSGDQSRTAAPADALKAGSNYLVVGRAITEAEEPRHVVNAIYTDLQKAVRAG